MHWGKSDQNIASQDIVTEHLRVLAEVVQDCSEFDVSSTDVYDALDYLEAIANRSWGFVLFREGLEKRDRDQRIAMIREGHRNILLQFK